MQGPTHCHTQQIPTTVQEIVHIQWETYQLIDFLSGGTGSFPEQPLWSLVCEICPDQAM